MGWEIRHRRTMAGGLWCGEAGKPDDPPPSRMGPSVGAGLSR